MQRRLSLLRREGARAGPGGCSWHVGRYLVAGSEIQRAEHAARGAGRRSCGPCVHHRLLAAPTSVDSLSWPGRAQPWWSLPFAIFTTSVPGAPKSDSTSQGSRSVDSDRRVSPVRSAGRAPAVPDRTGERVVLATRSPNRLHANSSTEERHDRRRRPEERHDRRCRPGSRLSPGGASPRAPRPSAPRGARTDAARRWPAARGRERAPRRGPGERGRQARRSSGR